MKFSLVFENSGDTIPFSSVNDAVVEYYVTVINQQNINRFSPFGDQFDKIKTCITELDKIILDTNDWIVDVLDKSINRCAEEEYLDQRFLNQLHADWVQSQTHIYDIDQKLQLPGDLARHIHDMYPDDIRKVGLGDLLSKLGKSFSYGQINKCLHAVESSFDSIKFKISDLDWFQVDNPFEKSVLSDNICNLSLNFHHLGRTLQNKFLNFDDNLEFNDENSYNELLGFVELSLVRPRTISISKEYITWCHARGREPIGDRLNLGNIPDLDSKLHNYRVIVYRNLRENNDFSVQLN